MLPGAAGADRPAMVLVLGSLLAVFYLMPIPLRAFLRPAAEPPAHGEARAAMVVPLMLTALGCVVLFYAADILISPLAGLLESP